MNELHASLLIAKIVTQIRLSAISVWKAMPIVLKKKGALWITLVRSSTANFVKTEIRVTDVCKVTG